ncbi:hypothetical protein ACP70R_011646 [Stipagrostis hirtigluma subsp. patula]
MKTKQQGVHPAMEAAGKRHRSNDAACTGDLAGDRLSALPDALLHEIMSLLKARQVVQTSVLSTRWRYLWRSVPCLDVDLDEFKTPGAIRDSTVRKAEWEKFEDFADNLLIRHDVGVARLDAFRLRVSRSNGRGEHATRLLRHAIKYGAQEPGIHRHGPRSSSSSSWRLRRLHLSNVNLDHRFAKHVTSGCHSLEDLDLTGCTCAMREIASGSLKNLVLKNCDCARLFDIASPMLKSLVIDGCKNNGYGRLAIMAPDLAVLFMAFAASQFARPVLLNEMPSLAKAQVHLKDIAEHTPLYKDQYKLLDSVSNVTNLELLGFINVTVLSNRHQVLGKEPVMFPQFKNLRTLLLSNCDLRDRFKTLTHFLRNSPKLEQLTLKHCRLPEEDPKKWVTSSKAKSKEKKASSSRSNIMDVHCENLKRTKIIYKDEDVHRLVKYLSSIGNLPNNEIELAKVY